MEFRYITNVYILRMGRVKLVIFMCRLSNYAITKPTSDLMCSHEFTCVHMRSDAHEKNCVGQQQLKAKPGLLPFRLLKPHLVRSYIIRGLL